MKKVVTGYSEDFKAEVLTEYAAGASAFALGRKHGVAPNTIEMWAAKAGIKQGTGSMREDVRQDIGKMVTDYMRANLRAMIAMAEHVTDKEWLNQQSAEGIALVMSTVHDKTVHLLSSMQANAEAEKLLAEQDLTHDGNHLLPTHPDYVDPAALYEDT